MREELSKQLFACFEREFAAKFPQFTLWFIDRGYWVWQSRLPPQTVVFVALHAFDRWDRFVLEIGWHSSKEFPWTVGSDREPESPEARVRLNNLSEDNATEVFWDLTPECTDAINKRYNAHLQGGDFVSYPAVPLAIAMPRIEPLVRDALEKLQQYAIPLFKRVAKVRGFDW